MSKTTLQAIKADLLASVQMRQEFLAHGTVYAEPEFAQSCVDEDMAKYQCLEAADTMMVDAEEFADTYMLGDGMSDKFLFARLAKLSEEVGEMATAAAADDEYEIADALVDIVYVALVTAAKRGHPFSKLWADVHKSNMTKTPKGVGKFGASKGEGFIPARTKDIMIEAGF